MHEMLLADSLSSNGYTAVVKLNRRCFDRSCYRGILFLLASRFICQVCLNFSPCFLFRFYCFASLLLRGDWSISEQATRAGEAIDTFVKFFDTHLVA